MKLLSWQKSNLTSNSRFNKKTFLSFYDRPTSSLSWSGNQNLEGTQIIKEKGTLRFWWRHRVENVIKLRAVVSMWHWWSSWCMTNPLIPSLHLYTSDSKFSKLPTIGQHTASWCKTRSHGEEEKMQNKILTRSALVFLNFENCLAF